MILFKNLITANDEFSLRVAPPRLSAPTRRRRPAAPICRRGGGGGGRRRWRRSRSRWRSRRRRPRSGRSLDSLFVILSGCSICNACWEKKSPATARLGGEIGGSGGARRRNQKTGEINVGRRAADTRPFIMPPPRKRKRKVAPRLPLPRRSAAAGSYRPRPDRRRARGPAGASFIKRGA